MARHRNNLTNQRFGHLLVLGYAENNPSKGITRWRCRCDCGNESTSVLYTSLTRKESTSCGRCDLVPRGPAPSGRRKDPVGHKFGRWTILARGRKSTVHYLARCECGTEKEVQYYQLRNGTSTSCGCFRKEFVAARARIYPKDNPIYLQHTTANPLYTAWLSMKTRCFNEGHPSYKRYGARGIKVCPEWKLSFHAFALHIGPKPSKHHSVERIDNNGHYEPGNVRWADKTDQAENTANNPWVIYDDERLRLRDLADKLEIDRSVLRYHHIILGKPLSEAVQDALESLAYLRRPKATTQPVRKPYTSFIDHTGEQISNYTIVQYQGRKHRTAPSEWLAECKVCGNTTILDHVQIKVGWVMPCAHRRPSTPVKHVHDDFC